MSEFTMTIVGLDSFKTDVLKGAAEIAPTIRQAMVYSTESVKNTAQELAPYKTGNLRRSIFTDIQDGGFTGIIAQDPLIANYGAGIEFGTAAHDIYPVNKQALFWKGAAYPVRHVRHPGSKAQPFMSPALEQNIEKIKAFFDDAMTKIIRTMAGK